MFPRKTFLQGKTHFLVILNIPEKKSAISVPRCTAFFHVDRKTKTLSWFTSFHLIFESVYSIYRQLEKTTGTSIPHTFPLSSILHPTAKSMPKTLRKINRIV